MKWTQPESESKLTLNSEIVYAGDSITAKILPSEIQIFGEQWQVSPENAVVVQDGYFRFNQLQLASSDQFLGLSGNYSRSKPFQTGFSLKHFDLKHFAPFAPIDFSGRVDMESYVTRDADSFLTHYPWRYGFSRANGGRVSSWEAYWELLLGCAREGNESPIQVTNGGRKYCAACRCLPAL